MIWMDILDVRLLALCVDGHFMLLHIIHILNPENRTQHPLLHVDSLKLECLAIETLQSLNLSANRSLSWSLF